MARVSFCSAASRSGLEGIIETPRLRDSLANLKRRLDVAVPGGVAGRPVFTLDGELFSWADVIAAARLDGSWRELQEMARQGVACQKRLAASGEQLAADEVVDATTRFRYALSLLAGEELQQWLGHWWLTAAEWRDYVKRMLLRERWAGELGDTAERFPVSDDELAGALWPEAVCSGFLKRLALKVAADGALAVAAGEAIAGDRGGALARIHPSAARARADAITADAVAHEIASHSLEWLRLEGSVLEFTAEDAAREAALCIRADGQPLAEVAEASGVHPRVLRVYVADVDAELSPILVAAREGELVGPVPRDGGFALLLVEKKTPPTKADPEVRRRAEERIVERAVDRAMRDHVQWHERL
jgi:hypothetical protein